MITRFAMFEGQVREGHKDAFRAAVHDRLVPLWRRFTTNTDVRVMFSEDRDDGAPEFPLILAITYPDLDGMGQALDCPERYASKDETAKIVAEHFDGKIHHHVTLMSEFSPTH